MERVRERLRLSGELDSLVASRLDELQSFCIDEVSDAKARCALIAFLAEIAPIEFFVAPASRGQHHPKWQNERAGIIRNTLECCMGIDRKMRAFPQLLDAKGSPIATDRDVLFIATILSDTFKHVDMEGEWKGFSHHRIAAGKWKALAQTYGLDQEFSDKVYDAIFWHLGRFTPEWNSDWRDPISHLSLHAFLVHMLDMDFSNKELERIFVPKSPVSGLASNSEKPHQISLPTPDDKIDFLKGQFDSSHSYFIHIETKLFSLVTFYSGLFVATISACYYILISTSFSGMRALPIGVAAVVFFLIGSFVLAMYCELRTRKIKALEQMALIREFFAMRGVPGEPSVSGHMAFPVGIGKCPPYLRRPSEDWYTVLLMMFVNSLALVSAIFALAPSLGVNPISVSRTHTIVGVSAGIIVFMVVFYRQFRRITLAMFKLDCDRKVRYGKEAEYDLFPKTAVSMARGLRWLDDLATYIESSEKAGSSVQND